MSERVVAGRMLGRSLDEFEQACEAWIEAEQGELLPDSAAIDLLCEAVRLSRDFADRRVVRDESTRHVDVLMERARCSALASKAVEGAVDVALGEVRRQGGADYLLREARNDGVFGGKTWIDEIRTPHTPDTRGSQVKERPMAQAVARANVAVSLAAGTQLRPPCSRCGRDDVETYGQPGESLECSLCMQMGRPADADKFVHLVLSRDVFESLECLIGPEAMEDVGSGVATAFSVLGREPSELAMTNLHMLFELVIRAGWHARRKKAAP